jgi:hypothetical protein
MKTFTLVALMGAIAFLLAGSLAAQHYVPTEPLNKNVIYEEFTGVRCPNCPAGHALLAQILADNPGRAFAVAYHPFNSSYTQPYPGDPDFRRHYADSLYMTPWCGTSRYMPSAFVARRLWAPGERLTSRTDWENFGNTIMAEPSPLNVGMATYYDAATGILSVTVDVFYTASVTGSHNLMVTLAENNLQSQQSGGTTPYTHKHTFRESFVGQWGDILSDGAQQGTFYRKVFSFDNNAMAYDMSNCELLAFVLDNTSEEVISGIGCNVGDTTFITPDITLSADTLYFNTAAQCIGGIPATIRNNTDVPLDLLDVQPASLVPGSVINWIVDPWPFTAFPHTLQPGDSVVLNVKVNLPVDNTMVQYELDSLKVVSQIESHYLMIAVDEDLLTSAGEPAAALPFSLAAFPNPFANMVNITFTLAGANDVILEILDAGGRKIAELERGRLNAGPHRYTWTCGEKGATGSVTGHCFVRLISGSEVVVKPLISIR